MYSTTPTFNLKVVLKETGLAADTLRAWERRYGLPSPQRTAGGHRLYSQRDIETIKWLMKRQSEGLSISRAVDLWNEHVGSGTDPLSDQQKTTPSSLPVQYQAADTTIASLRADWIEACLQFNEAQAEQVLNQAFSMFPVEVVCLDLLQKGMSDVGELWYGNKASVQQEHFASGLAMRRLDALLSASPLPTRPQNVIVGCPPDEWHSFTPLLLALLLRRRGLNVVYLGANVPSAQFAETVQNLKADLVVLVAQQLITAATLQNTALILANPKVPVAFGGRIFSIHPQLSHSIAGHFLGHSIPDALEQIEMLLEHKPRQATIHPTPPHYISAYEAYVSRRMEIEMTFRQMLEPVKVAPENIHTGIHFLGNNITAALQLGNIDYVSTEIEWLRVLLQAHITSPNQLVDFMNAYAEAVNHNINGKGKPIFEWLAAEVEKLRSG